jgi:hypothetical protein
MSLYFLWIVLKDVPAFRRTVNRQGTVTEPIRIVAKTIGGIEMTGTYGSNVTSPAASAAEALSVSRRGPPGRAGGGARGRRARRFRRSSRA